MQNRHIYLTRAFKASFIHPSKATLPYKGFWPKIFSCSCKFTESESLSSNLNTRPILRSRQFPFGSSITTPWTKLLCSCKINKTQKCRSMSIYNPRISPNKCNEIMNSILHQRVTCQPVNSIEPQSYSLWTNQYQSSLKKPLT